MRGGTEISKKVRNLTVLAMFMSGVIKRDSRNYCTVDTDSGYYGCIEPDGGW